ncbi:MAG TPA: TadE/TadG family type IV pilus assembly protein [Bryobacteraceae bacterium]|nr:TadE/TadG family type IV pilus assembly protein [Bryobacteraceae bacterium]
MTARKTKRPTAGHSLVEFALILPLLLLLTINAVNFGAFFYAWITVANAARSASQYAVLSGAAVSSPKSPTSSQVYSLVAQDISSLRNTSSLAVRICTNKNGTISCNSTGSGTFSNPAADTRPEANLFVMAWVDVLYTYEPLIPAFNFPNLGVHATLPPTPIHRQSVMRMLQ